MSVAEQVARLERGWRLATLLAFVCCVALAIAALAMDLAGVAKGTEPAVAQGWTSVFPALALAIPGALLLWQRPAHPIAVVLLASGVLWAVDGVAAAWVNVSVDLPDGLPGAAFAFWMFERFGAWLLVGLPLLLVLFPDGRLPGGRWRAVSVASVVAVSLLPLALLLAPAAELIDVSDPLDPRLAPLVTAPIELELPPNVWTALIPVMRLAVPVGFVGAIAVAVHRRRGADQVGRAQLRWLIWGASAAALGLLSWFAVPQLIANVLSTIGIAAFSASILIAITRYRLYEIDGLIGWTLISALLAFAFFAIDGLLLALLGVSGPAGPVAAVSAAVVGAIYLPLRERLRRAVRRLVSGRREEPFEVLIDLADRLEAANAVDEQLAAVADAAREAFLSPRVILTLQRASGEAITVDRGDGLSPVAEHYPVTYRGRQLAVLGMAVPRRPRLSRNDRRLLDALMGHAISAIRLGEAHEELNVARTRLVASREDERLRMRRELHDGIGPLLSGVVLRLDSASARLASTGAGAGIEELISSAAGDASHAVDEVRRVAHGLRPAVLTELGLRAAVEQQCARLSSGAAEIDAVLDLPGELPAAVEVAAYRIVSEAVTNIVRHSGAQRAQVELAVRDGELRIVVDDDGAGLGTGARGQGLDSQRMRAEELGGQWRIEASPLGGVRVAAEIPIDSAYLSEGRAR